MSKAANREAIDKDADSYAEQPFIGDLYSEYLLAEEVDQEAGKQKSVKRYARGLILCATIAIAATWIGDHYGMPVILIGLLLGLALNFSAQEERVHAGLDLAATTGLRWGIVLIGLQVTVAQIAQIGVLQFLCLLAIMGFAFVGGLTGAKLAGQSRYAGLLAGGATAICGASAALALYGIIGKDRLPQAYFALTLLCVALASAVAMTFYPIMASYLSLNDQAAGFLIGSSVHDVAQAIGSGYSYSDAAGTQATIIKLARVALLVPAVFLVSLWIRNAGAPVAQPVLKRITPPWFILGFLALTIFNSLVTVPSQITEGATTLAKALLLLAVTSTALRSRTDLVMQLGWRAAMPVVCATLASFLAAVTFTLLFIR